MDHPLNQQPIDVTQVIQDAIDTYSLAITINPSIKSVLLTHDGLNQFVELIFSKKVYLPGTGLEGYIEAIYSQYSSQQRRVLHEQLGAVSSIEEKKLVFLRQFAIDELRGLIAALDYKDPQDNPNQYLNKILIETQKSVISKLEYSHYSRVIQLITEAATQAKPRNAPERSVPFLSSLQKTTLISVYAETIIQDGPFLGEIRGCLYGNLLTKVNITRLSHIMAQHAEKEMAKNTNRTQISEAGLKKLKETILSSFAESSMANTAFWSNPDSDNTPSQLDELSNFFRRKL